MQKKVVLIIDDEKIIANLFKDLLTPEGFSSIIVNSGNEAIPFILKQKLDLVLSDLNMENGDGYLVLEELKKSDLNKGCPIIFCTGLLDKSVEENLLSLGAFKLLEKPHCIRELVSVVRKI